jgi:hypothetical protein
MALQTVLHWQVERRSRHSIERGPGAFAKPANTPPRSIVPMASGAMQLDWSMARQSKICQIHHDEFGQIIQIDILNPEQD